MKTLFRYRLYFFRTLFLLVGFTWSCSFQGSGTADEYAVKSMFLYNFTKYIDWSNSNPGGHFIIAVCGKSEITTNLRMMAANKKVNNRIIEIKSVLNLEDLDNCQILFISKTENHQLPAAIAKFGSKGILLVTEDTDMAQKGSCINIITSDEKIKFELNESAVKRDGLKIASQLQTLAIVLK